MAEIESYRIESNRIRNWCQINGQHLCHSLLLFVVINAYSLASLDFEKKKTFHDTK